MKDFPPDLSVVSIKTVLHSFPAGFKKILSGYDFLLLFIGIYLVYNTVSFMTMSDDTAPAALLPISIILHHTLNFDWLFNPGLSPDATMYAFPRVNGHYVSLFPIVTPILITPVYGIAYALFTPNLADFGNIILLAKTCASIIAALSCVFVYLVGKELFSKKIAIITVLIYAFATSTWSVSGQALWQHGMVELLLILMIYVIIRNERNESAKNIILLGILSGLFVFNRPPDAILLIPIIAYVIWYARKNIYYYVIPAVLSGLPFLWYNLTIFGNVFGGYKENLGFFSFNFNFITNFFGLLISPNVGLIIFCPVVILSIWGYQKLDKITNARLRWVLLLFGPVIILQILSYSFFELWASSTAFSFGQRFLTGFMPIIAILIGLVLNDRSFIESKSVKDRTIWILVALLIISSIVIQITGVYFYPLNPDRTMSIEKAWNWKDSIIVESYFYGVSHINSITTYIFPQVPPVFYYQF